MENKIDLMLDAAKADPDLKQELIQHVETSVNGQVDPLDLTATSMNKPRIGAQGGGLFASGGERLDKVFHLFDTYLDALKRGPLATQLDAQEKAQEYARLFAKNPQKAQLELFKEVYNIVDPEERGVSTGDLLYMKSATARIARELEKENLDEEEFAAKKRELWDTYMQTLAKYQGFDFLYAPVPNEGKVPTFFAVDSDTGVGVRLSKIVPKNVLEVASKMSTAKAYAFLSKYLQKQGYYLMASENSDIFTPEGYVDPHKRTEYPYWEPIFVDKKNGHVKHLHSSEGSEILANLAVDGWDLILGLAGGIGASVLAERFTGPGYVGFALSGTAGAAGATAGGAVGEVVNQSIQNLITTGTLDMTPDEMLDVVENYAKKNFWKNELFYVGIPLGIKLALDLVRLGGSFVSGMYRAIKDAYGLGEPYAPEKSLLQAYKYLKQHQQELKISDKELVALENKMSKYLDLPKDELERRAMALTASEKSSTEILKESAEAVRYNAQAAKSLRDTMAQVTNEIKRLAGKTEPKITELATGLSKTEKSVNGLYNRSVMEIKKIVGNKPVRVSNKLRRAAGELGESLQGLKDTPLANKLFTLSAKLSRREGNIDDLLEAYKAVNSLDKDAKTFVGKQVLRKLRQGIRETLGKASPKALKTFEDMNRIYSTFAKVKSTKAFQSLSNVTSTLKEPDTLLKLATNLEGKRPQFSILAENLSPEARKKAEEALLNAILEKSRQPSKFMNMDVVDFAKTEKYFKAIQPYAKDIFKYKYPQFKEMQEASKLFKNYSVYLSEAIKAPTVGQKMSREANSWLSWGAVRLKRALTEPLITMYNKDRAFQKVFAKAIVHAKGKDIKPVLEQLAKNSKGLKHLPQFYDTVQKAMQKLKAGKSLDGVESYAMFGVPFGVDVKVDKNGKIEKIDFDTTRMALGVFGGFFVTKVAGAFKTKLTKALKAGMSEDEIYKKYGIYKARDGKWRMVIPNNKFRFKSSVLMTESQRRSLEADFNALKKVSNQIAQRIARDPLAQIGLIDDETKKLMEQAETIRNRLANKLEFKLVDVVKEGAEDPLFKIYPELKNVKVRFDPTMEPGVGGFSRSDEVRINAWKATLENRKTANGTLRHEVQHLIQDRSGFAAGGGIEDALYAHIMQRYPEARYWLQRAAKAKSEAEFNRTMRQFGKFMEKQGYRGQQDYFKAHAKEIFETYRREYGEMEAEASRLSGNMREKDLKKMFSKNITPEDIMAKKYHLSKDWSEVVFKGRENLLDIHVKDFHGRLKSTSTKMQIENVKNLAFAPSDQVKKLEAEILKTKSGKKTLAEMEKLGLKNYLALVPEERYSAIKSPKFVRSVYEDVKKHIVPKVEELVAAAKAGVDGKGWARATYETFKYIFGAKDAEQFAWLTAATSPKKEVKPNLEQALRIWNKWLKAGRPRDLKAIRAILKTEKGVLNPKGITEVLLKGKLSPTDSNFKIFDWGSELTGKFDRGTIDTHMARLLGHTDISQMKPHEYAAYQAQMKLAANVLTKQTGVKWTPADVQETVWTFAKGLSDLAENKNVSLAKLLKLIDKNAVVEVSKKGAQGYVDYILQDKTIQKLIREGGYNVDFNKLRQLNRRIRDVGNAGVKEAARRTFTDRDWKALRSAAKKLISSRERFAGEKNWEELRQKIAHLSVSKSWSEPEKGVGASFQIIDPSHTTVYVGGKPKRLYQSEAVVNLTPVGGVSNEEFIHNSQKYISELKRMARRNGVVLHGDVSIADGLFAGEREKSLQLVVSGPVEKIKKFAAEYGKKYNQFSVHVGELGKQPRSVAIKVPKEKMKEVDKLLQEKGFGGATLDHGILRIDFIPEYLEGSGKATFKQRAEYRKFIQKATELAKEMNAPIEFKNINVTPLFNRKFVSASNVEYYDKYVKVHPSIVGAMLGFELKKDERGHTTIEYNPVKGALGALGGFMVYSNIHRVSSWREFKALVGWMVKKNLIHLRNAKAVLHDVKFAKYTSAFAQTASGVDSKAGEAK